MGCCCGPVSESDKEIQSHMLDEASTDHHIKKLLLLGSGSSGKSTLFKQLRCIHGRGLDEHDFLESGHYIKQNCVTGILKLVIQSQELCTEEEIDELNRDSTFIQSVQCLLRFKHETFYSSNVVSIEDLRNIGIIRFVCSFFALILYRKEKQWIMCGNIMLSKTYFIIVDHTLVSLIIWSTFLRNAWIYLQMVGIHHMQMLLNVEYEVLEWLKLHLK